MIKKYFATGLVILLPVALTLVIVIFIFNLLTEPFAGAVKSIFTYFGLFQNGFLFFGPDQFQQFISQILVLVFLFFATVALGAIARGVLLHYMVTAGETLLAKIPFISSIYKTSKDVVKTIFTSTDKSFKRVVLVPFPMKGVYGVGFITRENLMDQLTSVFIPTTPNPTSGLLLLYDPKDIIYLDMKVDDAFKFIVSCGVVPIPFKVISEEIK